MRIFFSIVAMLLESCKVGKLKCHHSGLLKTYRKDISIFQTFQPLNENYKSNFTKKNHTSNFPTLQLFNFTTSLSLCVGVVYKISSFGHNHKQAHKIVRVFVSFQEAGFQFFFDHVMLNKLFQG